MNGDTTAELSLPPGQRRASDRDLAEFRRRVAYYSLAVLTLFGGALLMREADLGNNTTALLQWVVFAFGFAIVGALSSKAAEGIAQAMAARGPK